MSETVLLARGRQILEILRQQWEKHVGQAPLHARDRLSFMSEAHHAVRLFVVRELPRIGEPLSPEFISQALKLPLDQTQTILAELEKNLFFLVRDEAGAVS